MESCRQKRFPTSGHVCLSQAGKREVKRRSSIKRRMKMCTLGNDPENTITDNSGSLQLHKYTKEMCMVGMFRNHSSKLHLLLQGESSDNTRSYRYACLYLPYCDSERIVFLCAELYNVCNTDIISFQKFKGNNHRMPNTTMR